MSSFQKNGPGEKTVFTHAIRNKNERGLTLNGSEPSGQAQKLRDIEAKKKLNRFFAGLPFNPEP